MDNNQTETELLEEFYEDIRESVLLSMEAEGIDEETREAVINTVDDAV